MSTTSQEPRRVVVTLPSSDESDTALGRLGRVMGEFEAIGMNVANVVGDIGTHQWEARLEQPPTIEELGGVWLFVQYARGYIETISKEVDRVEAAMPALDGLRLEDMLREAVADAC